MPDPAIATFSITTPSTTAKLDANRKAQVAFTVTNTSIQPLKGRARVLAMDGAKPEWFVIEGDAERAFASSGTQQYSVLVNAPATAPAGKYKFQLKMVGVANPDEQYGESDQVAFEVPQPVKPSTPLPMWIWIVAAVVALLILGGTALGFYLANRKPAASFNPASVDFGNQNLGVVSASKTVRITSSGGVDLHIKSVAIANEQYKQEFQRSTDSCSGKTIASGKSCTVDVVFKPGATGARSASLVFTMDTEPGSKSIVLNGQGVQSIASPTASVSPSSGCATTTTFTFTGTIPGNGTGGIVTYHWLRSDGATSRSESVTLVQGAPSATVTTSWTLGSAAPHGTYWEQLVITGPNQLSSNQATFRLC